MLISWNIPRALLCTIYLILSSSLYADSPYISRVWEYQPAPGQFINLLPEWEEGDNQNLIRLKAEEAIADNQQGMISLGGFGGYVVFGFDHLVLNSGNYDFKILGNAFVANSNPNTDRHGQGGSAEPGVVMVSFDSNKNGKPDDEWYELAGSEYHNPLTVHNYRITYYRPLPDHVPTPDQEQKFLIDTTYIRWKDSNGTVGYIPHSSYHTQSYWPEWIDADSLVFTGTLLPPNAIDESGNGSYYVLYSYDYGYADNYPNAADESNMKISWAVDKDGNPVKLPGINFVKVYTGLNQLAGWLGETSTEIMGAEDLHPTTNLNHEQVSAIILINSVINDKLIISSSEARHVQVISAAGQIMFSANLNAGTNYIGCTCLPQGMYMLRADNETIRFIKQ